LYQVKKLCDSALWLRQGRVAALGAVDEVIDAYLEYARVRDQEETVPEAARPHALLRLVEVALEGGEGGDPPTWQSGTPLEPGVGVAFVRNDGLVCYCVSTEMDGVAMERQGDRTYGATLHIPELPLLGGGYYLNVATTNNRSALLVYDVQERRCPFRVRSPSHEYGVMRMEHRWLPSAAARVTG
jgi:lipopolysaccharide transport system ATP-binding protein